MRTDVISSSSSSTASSSAVTIYGIPVIYIVIVILLILFILYLLCRIKRKDSHDIYVMKKSSYIKLFIGCFAPLFIYNLYNIFYSIWVVNPNLIFLYPGLSVLDAIVASLLESIIPYSFITLSILTINCYRKSS